VAVCHHLQGRGHIVAAALQAAQLVIIIIIIIITCRATVVKSFRQFWMNVESAAITEWRNTPSPGQRTVRAVLFSEF